MLTVLQLQLMILHAARTISTSHGPNDASTHLPKSVAFLVKLTILSLLASHDMTVTIRTETTVDHRRSTYADAPTMSTMAMEQLHSYRMTLHSVGFSRELCLLRWGPAVQICRLFISSFTDLEQIKISIGEQDISADHFMTMQIDLGTLLSSSLSYQPDITFNKATSAPRRGEKLTDNRLNFLLSSAVPSVAA